MMMAGIRGVCSLWVASGKGISRWHCPRALSILPAASVTANNTNHSHCGVRNDRHWRKWSQRTKLLCVTAGSCLVLGFSFHSVALCEPKRRHMMNASKLVVPENLPQLTLYQYATCPFCCKTRAYLDYYKIPYDIVEVNPLFKREMKFSNYRKVPFIVSKDGTQVSLLNICRMQCF